MIIRKATLSDANEIAKNNVLLAKEIEQRTIDLSTAKNGSEAVLSDERNGFYLIAEDNHHVIGQVFITFEWSDWRNQCIWWMHRVYVHKQWRKKGIFTALLQEIKQIATENNVYVLRLYVVKSNKNAIKIYKKSGFEDAPFIILQDKKL
jgi:GNAT superfamily N-acetyltransferase